MKIIVPNKLTLLSCSIAENDSTDGTAWSAGATYAKDAKVRHSHISYQSLEADNKGNNPANTWSGLEAKWKKLEATMPWKMLDDFVETQTKAASGQNLSFCVPFNRADSFALLNMEGYSLDVKIYDLDEPAGEQLVYHEIRSLIEDIYHFSLFEYNYFPIVTIKSIWITDLPQVFNGKLCITLTPGAEDEFCAVGHIVAGMGRQLGLTLYGSERGFTDYSRKTTDEFGVTTLVRRSFSSNANLSVYLHPDQMDYASQTLEEVRSMPCLWVGDNTDYGHRSLTIYGWLEDFRLVCEGPNEVELSLDIQGLI